MKNSIVFPNDILLNITGASLGRSCVVPNDFEIGNVNQHVCIIRLNKSFLPRFIQPIFSSNKGQAIFQSLQTGSGREGLNFESIKGIKISMPSIQEQKKIAEFLSALDSKIQTQKKTLLHYESLIQKLRDDLLSQKIKLNDDFPKWQKVELYKLGFTFNGLSGKNKDDFGSGRRYIQYKQIFDSSSIILEHCGYVNISNNEKQNIVQYGDIFFTISSETPNEIGMSSVLLEET